ncbi:MAG TPA: hypothetical protein VFQ53_09430 [Kofleriaceae bacterium]|nr:hypothetical protein [Kofleriaceae bacterium]
MSSLLIAGAVTAQPAADKKGTGTTAKTPAKGTPSKDKAPATGSGSDTGSAGPTASNTPAPTPVAKTDPSTVPPADMPTAVRMRRLEQKTQALKERAWQLKARVQMLKEQMLGGGVGAQTLVTHSNEMGSSFRLTKLIYSLDGTQVFARTDETGESLYKTKSFDIFSGPIAPGNHNLSVVAIYRGHGYGVFEYLSKYTFTAKGAQSFVAGEGKVQKVDCKGYEKGGPTVPLEKRAAVECKVTEVVPDKPAPTPPAPTPTGTTTPPPGK